MTVAIVLCGVLAAACVVWVAHPYLREPVLPAAADRLAETDDAGRERLLLAEERDRALDALRELEFDHRAGKISDEDYGNLVRGLRADAASVLKALDEASA